MRNQTIYAAILAVTGTSLAAPPELADAKRFDVTKLSTSMMGCPDAVPDDGLDDSPAFVCAMGYFRDRPGVLHVPVGTFVLSEEIAVPQRSQVIGDGYGSVIFQSARSDGYWLTKSLISLESNSILRDLKLDQEQTASKGSFTVNPNFTFMVEARRQDILIENILMFKTYKGIIAGSLGGGRITMRNIRGQPLMIGIEIDDSWDVIRVQDVHFWPYWSDQLDCNFSCSNGGAEVSEFVQRNATGIVTKKNDNSFMNNITTLGYYIGILFDDGAKGVTSKAKISQFDCDFCGTGIELRAKGSRGNVVQSMSFLGAPSLPVRVPLTVTGFESGISVSEANVDDVSASAVLVTGGGNFVRVSQWYVRRWNVNNNSSKAFVDSGASNKLWVRESYGRWGQNGGPCSGALSCEFTLGQPL